MIPRVRQEGQTASIKHGCSATIEWLPINHLMVAQQPPGSSFIYMYFVYSYKHKYMVNLGLLVLEFCVEQ